MPEDVAINPFVMEPESSERMDGSLINTVSGMGTSRDIDSHYQIDQAGGRFGGRFYKQQFDQLIETNWIIQRATTAYASGSTRAWVDLKIEEEHGGGSKTLSQEKTLKNQERKNRHLKQFTEYEKDLKIRDIFQCGLFYAAAYGGAAAVMNIEDGRHYSEPVDKKNIRSIRYIRLYDGFEIQPECDRQHQDPNNPKYYRFNVTPQEKMALIQMKGKDFAENYPLDLIHHSRVIPFQGMQVTKDSMKRNTPQNWGKSVIEMIFDVFARHEAAQSGASNMIRLWDLFTYKMEGFKNLASTGKLPELVERFRVIQLMMNMFNGVMLDSKEEAQFQSRNFSGINSILAELKNEMIGASGVPHTILYGDTPNGLGATGDAEFAVWSELNYEFQEAKIRSKLEDLYKLFFLAKDGPTGGVEPDSWSFTFKPIVRESMEKKLNARNLQLNLDSIALQNQLLLPQEVRSSRWGAGGEFSFETQLDDDAWRERQEKLRKQEEAFDVNSLFAQENADPEAQPQQQDPNAAPDQQQAQPPAKAGAGSNANTAVSAANAAANPQATANKSPTAKKPKPEEKRDSRHYRYDGKDTVAALERLYSGTPLAQTFTR